VWLACKGLDIRAGTESVLASVVKVIGEARPHHVCLLVKQRVNRWRSRCTMASAHHWPQGGWT